ncbi:MAG: type II secretion system minor pseudopilin GspJ [Steroidobacteraceae bacterium]
MTRARHSGFTLVEILVALFIAAILFAIGYSVVNQGMIERERLAQRQARLLQLARAMRVISQDVAQLEARPVRDTLGAGLQPALDGSRRGEELLILTRSGWANPAGLPRSTLQRVQYLRKDKQLIRAYLPVLDAAQGVLPLQRVLLDGVDDVKLRFMDNGRRWLEQWPVAIPGSQSGLQQFRSLPIAIEITVRLEDVGEIVRIIETPA